MEYELRYRLDDGKQRTAVVPAANVSQAVHAFCEVSCAVVALHKLRYGTVLLITSVISQLPIQIR